MDILSRYIIINRYIDYKYFILKSDNELYYVGLSKYGL